MSSHVCFGGLWVFFGLRVNHEKTCAAIKVQEPEVRLPGTLAGATVKPLI